MRALITGGRGFVGRWLAAHLREAGDDVVVVDTETDVTDEAAIDRAVSDARPDAVYHLAARSHVGESWRDPLDVLRVNVLGTAAVLAATRRARTIPSVSNQCSPVGATSTRRATKSVSTTSVRA